MKSKKTNNIVSENESVTEIIKNPVLNLKDKNAVIYKTRKEALEALINHLINIFFYYDSKNFWFKKLLRNEDDGKNNLDSVVNNIGWDVPAVKFWFYDQKINNLDFLGENNATLIIKFSNSLIKF